MVVSSTVSITLRKRQCPVSIRATIAFAMEAKWIVSGRSAAPYLRAVRSWTLKALAIRRSTFVVMMMHFPTRYSSPEPHRDRYLFLSSCPLGSSVEIPEKARHAPNYGPVVARQVVTSTPAPTSTTKTTSSRLIITNPPPTTAVRRQVATSPVVRTTASTTTTTTAATTSKLNDITPPVRHLQPPALPETAQAAVSAASAQIKAARLVDDRSPAQFGLRMKNKMRFSRSVRRRLRQALNIQEPFPVVFDEHFVADLHRRIRQKRSILGSSADNHDHDHHHHHHDHDEPVDTGCSILGVHYLLGQVVGKVQSLC